MGNLSLVPLILAAVTPATKAKCNSATACFSIKTEGDSAAQFNNAAVPSGYNYGVDVHYGDDHQSLFADIWDSDGDMFVNITGSNGGYCVIDIGASMSPYMRLIEQSGLACDFEMETPTGKAPGQTFSYDLKATRHEDTSVD